MPTATHRAAHHPDRQRNFGKIYDVFPVPDLTEIQTRSYERFLQADVAAEKRADSGLEGVFREIFPIESYDKTLKLEYVKLRPRQAALRARRVPPAAPDLRPPVPRLAAAEQGETADRGRGLPRRHADHDRRRRVHHQRRRARRRQPAAPLPGRRLRRRDRGRRQASCTPAASSPSAAAGSSSTSPRRTPSASASTSRGKFSAMTLLRAMDPKYALRRRDPPRVLRDRDRSKIGDGRSVAKLEGRIACRRRRRPAAATAGEIMIESGQTITKNVGRGHLPTPGSASIEVMKDAKDPLILNSRSQEDPTTEPRRSACCGSTSGSGRATRRSWRRPASSSTRSSSTPTATAWARSAGSASTASSTRTIPEDEMTLRPEDYVNAIRTSSTSARARGTSTTSTTWATAACGRSTSWPPTNSARASSSSAAPCRSG